MISNPTLLHEAFLSTHWPCFTEDTSTNSQTNNLDYDNPTYQNTHDCTHDYFQHQIPVYEYPEKLIPDKEERDCKSPLCPRTTFGSSRDFSALGNLCRFIQCLQFFCEVIIVFNVCCLVSSFSFYYTTRLLYNNDV